MNNLKALLTCQKRNCRNSYYKNESSKDLIEELDKLIHTF